MRYLLLEVGDCELADHWMGDSIGALVRAIWDDEAKSAERDAAHWGEEPHYNMSFYRGIRNALESRNHWPPGNYELSWTDSERAFHLFVIP